MRLSFITDADEFLMEIKVEVDDEVPPILEWHGRFFVLSEGSARTKVREDQTARYTEVNAYSLRENHLRKLT